MPSPQDFSQLGHLEGEAAEVVPPKEAGAGQARPRSKGPIAVSPSMDASEGELRDAADNLTLRARIFVLGQLAARVVSLHSTLPPQAIFSLGSRGIGGRHPNSARYPRFRTRLKATYGEIWRW